MADSALEGGTIAAAGAMSLTDIFYLEQGSTGSRVAKFLTVTALLAGVLGSTVLTGATVTTSKPILDLAQTWNAGAVAFTGLKFNVTDTASAAGSLLLDLQVGGSSKFSVSKTGVATVGSINSGNATFGNNSLAVSTTGNTIIWNAGVFGFSSSSSVTSASSADTIFTRKGAANWQLGNADAAAPVAQTLSVQSVVTGTANTAGANFTINGSNSTGSAAGGSIIFQTAAAGGAGSTPNTLAAALIIASTKEATFAGQVTVPGAAVPIIKTTATITSGAAGNTGTLTNAPAVGNPTSWIPINDNGVTRYIPAW